MNDPLNDGGWGAEDTAPAWPTTPHSAGDALPNMPRPATPRAPSSATDLRGPASPFGREGVVYGQPEQGLVSPREATASNGASFERAEGYLRVKITGLDRNRRDILVRFDAQTNLSNFTGTTYRNVQRSYLEFQQFCEALVHSCPQTLVPALPFAQTSAPTDEEDDRLVKIMLQRWMTRVCEDTILLHDEELRAFVESDFGYQPTPRPRRKGGSGFSLIRRGVPDEDEELQKARFELTKLEGQFFEAAKGVDNLTRHRKSLAQAHAEMGNKLINVATTEAHPHLANAMRKIGRTWHSVADLDQAQAISECVILGDSLGYQGLNARSAKETLQMRTSVLEEHQAAAKSAISKRRNIERLKASASIRPDKVDEALEQMEEAQKYEQILQKRADGISQNLHRALLNHRTCVTDDVTAALVEHVRSSIMYEKQLLRELEALRPDINNAASNAPVQAAAAPPPRPIIVPPLEDFNAPPRPPPRQHNSNIPGSLGGTLGVPRGPPTAGPLRTTALPPTLISPRGPMSSGPLSPQTPGAGPSSPALAPASPASTSGRAGPLGAPAQPPLGGRFVTDGSQSMFMPRPSQMAGPQTPTSPLSASVSAAPGLPTPSNGEPGVAQPNGGFMDPLSRPVAAAAPSMNGTVKAAPFGAVDPLGGLSASTMGTLSGSIRGTQSRSKLDSREAARKLANMF